MRFMNQDIFLFGSRSYKGFTFHSGSGETRFGKREFILFQHQYPFGLDNIIGLESTKINS